jgi:hypothetical protein
MKDNTLKKRYATIAISTKSNNLIVDAVRIIVSIKELKSFIQSPLSI